MIKKETVRTYEDCCGLPGFKRWDGMCVIRDLWDKVPVVKNIERKILRYITAKPERFNMRAWHTASNGRCLSGYFTAEHPRIANCSTAHCLAGWAQYLAGQQGLNLVVEMRCDSSAGAAIFAKSCGWVPDFLAGDEEALAELEARVAALDAEGL